jgi:SNF2 family DNA or RNA helicase
VTRECALLVNYSCYCIVLQELYYLLELCAPEDFESWSRFNNQYGKPIEEGSKPGASEYQSRRGEKVAMELQTKINPFILRRDKVDHLQGLIPPSHEFDGWTRLSQSQRKLYSEYTKAFFEREDYRSNNKVAFIGCVFPAITKLRKLCQHPLIFNDGLEKYTRAAFMLTLQSIGKDELIAMSPKMIVLLELLHMWRQEGCKILVFTHFIKMLDIIQFVLDGTAGFQVCRIDGKTKQDSRGELVKEFNKASSHFNIMLLSVTAGGVGLSLTGANKSVVFDPAWNLAMSDQAVARTSRPGQTRECECIHLLAAGTVEEKVRPTSKHS